MYSRYHYPLTYQLHSNLPSLRCRPSQVKQLFAPDPSAVLRHVVSQLRPGGLALRVAAINKAKSTILHYVNASFASLCM